MPTKRPTIASCPHCRAILLRTERALIHPTGVEREGIERALGEFWVEHSTTRFDGRFHRCLGVDSLVFASSDRRSTDESRDGPDSGHSPYRGPHRALKATSQLRRSLLVGAICACFSPSAVAQESLGPPPRGLPPGFLDESADRFEVRSLLAETIRVGQASNHRSPAALTTTATDLTQLLGHLPPPQANGLRRTVDDHVVLVAAAAEAGSVLSLDPTPSGQSSRAGSWQGLELASGRYQIVDTLREAAAGVVYLAHDRNLDADVVVEVPALPPEHDPESKAHFIRAVRSLARLVHPHLVKVTEVGIHDDAPFVIAEHRPGGSLKFRRPVGPDGRPAPVPPDSLEQWLPDISDALDYLHTRNRIYREISPANILFDEHGRASLGGLGVAQATAEWLRPATVGSEPAGRRLAGPSPILAPEVVAGGPADGRADQYALAATVYELLSGRPPFERRTQPGPPVQTSATEPPELCRICPSISEALSSAVHRGLSRDPEHRFPDCTTFARAVISAAHQPGPTALAANPPTAVTPAPEFGQRRPLLAIPTPDHPVGSQTNRAALGLACSALIVVVGAMLSRLRSRRTANPRELIPRPVTRQPIPQAPCLTGPLDFDRTARALPDSSNRQESVKRALEVRRHPAELARRSHLPQVPALLHSGSTGEGHQLPDLDPAADYPRARLADNLLPVLATAPKPGPLALRRRSAS